MLGFVISTWAESENTEIIQIEGCKCIPFLNKLINLWEWEWGMRVDFTPSEMCLCHVLLMF